VLLSRLVRIPDAPVEKLTNGTAGEPTKSLALPQVPGKTSDRPRGQSGNIQGKESIHGWAPLAEAKGASTLEVSRVGSAMKVKALRRTAGHEFEIKLRICMRVAAGLGRGQSHGV
jgi:hypothetical protein